jgi:glutathione S-transferase
VRLALALKNIPYEYISIDWIAPEDFKKINPNEAVPAL